MFRETEPKPKQGECCSTRRIVKPGVRRFFEVSREWLVGPCSFVHGFPYHTIRTACGNPDLKLVVSPERDSTDVDGARDSTDRTPGPPCAHRRAAHPDPAARSADEKVFAYDGVYAGGQSRRRPRFKTRLIASPSSPIWPAVFGVGSLSRSGMPIQLSKSSKSIKRNSRIIRVKTSGTSYQAGQSGAAGTVALLGTVSFAGPNSRRSHKS